ncbi:MAG: peptidylprolyl isomerase [Anaerolineales bacterium]|nr:peptidylprolyl isomerase [Anaerolineales bacterium]
MTDGISEVADNVVVSVDYVLRVDDKSEIDRSAEGSPLEYLHGYKNIIPGLEKELNGMTVGDEKDVVVQPNLGYGDRDPDSVVEYPRDSFPSTLDLEVGEPVMMRDNQNGESHKAYISELRTDTVLLDFNHPLAGETLHFSVKIAGLREPTSEELTHGHVHNGSHDH